MSELLEKGLIMAMGIITLSILTPFLFPLLNSVSMNENIQNYLIAEADFQQFVEDVRSFEMANQQYNITNRFNFSKQIIVFEDKSSDRQILNFYFFPNSSNLYHYNFNICLNSSYSIFIYNFEISKYDIFFENSSFLINFI